MITSKKEAIFNIAEAKREQTLREYQKLTELIETHLKTTTNFTITTNNYSKPALDAIMKELIQGGYDVQVFPNYIKVS